MIQQSRQGVPDFEAFLPEYRESGYVRIPHFFSEGEIQEIRDEMTRFIAEVAPNLKGKEINYSGDQINSIHAVSQNSEYFERLLRSEKMMRMAKTFLEDEPEPRYVEYFAKPALKGLPSPMHQDNYYWAIKGGNGLTVWIALDRSDDENGGVTYYRGSHRWGLLDHTASFAPGSSQAVKDKVFLEKNAHLRESFVLEPGDIQVHHALTVHGSASNVSPRPRRGLTLQFKGKSSTYDFEHLAKYQASLNEQMKMRGQI